MKSKHHYKKYAHWTEAPEQVIYRDLPAVAAQHDFLRHHGVKHRKHLNTHYMFDKHMLYKISNSIQTKWIRRKHVIELYPGFGLLSLRLMKKGIG